MRTELHFHLLPGVDDGPTDDAEAVELAWMAVQDGTGLVVATPHMRLLVLEELEPRLQRLRARLRAAHVPLQVRGGAELSPDDVPNLTLAALEQVAQGPADRRWLLLEAPLTAQQAGFVPAAAELRERGFGVLVGHPERCPTIGIAELHEQVERGSILQINASSLTGVHGVTARRRGLEIARSGLPFIVASDAHSPSRPPLLSDAAGALAAAGIERSVIRAAIETWPAELLRDGLPDQRPAAA